MNCLILGGTGFLGANLCEGLYNNGHELIVYDRPEVKITALNKYNDRIKFILKNFTQENDFLNILDGVDYVFHLVSTTIPHLSNENMRMDIVENILPTLELFKAISKTSVKKIIFFSSGGTVYGVPHCIPITEEHPTEPICSYGIHKLTIEKYLHLYEHLYGLDYAVVRISNPYGKGQIPFGQQGLIATALGSALSGKTMNIWGDGSIVRDYIYVSDVIEAVLMLMKYEGTRKVFNIGTGIGISIRGVIEEIEYVLQQPLNVRYCLNDQRKEDVPVNILDISTATKELKWKPCINFRQGLKLMLNSWTPDTATFCRG